MPFQNELNMQRINLHSNQQPQKTNGHKNNMYLKVLLLQRNCQLLTTDMLFHLRIKPLTSFLPVDSIALLVSREIQARRTRNVILHIQLLRSQQRRLLIITNHLSFGLSMKYEEYDLSLLYWNPKSYKCPCKQFYIP